jgi:hypothetical protein
MLGYVIGEARRIISYHANLTEDQRPPQSIWHSQRKSAAWIEAHRPGGSSESKGSLYFSDNEIE